MAKLSVNIDHVATIREARKIDYPDPVAAAVLSELAGCDGIIVHLREDRRHINDRDVRILKETVKTKLNLEMAAADEIVKIACEVKPYMATLVPEKREELTTEGGLEVRGNKAVIEKVVDRLHKSGIKASLFIDPDNNQVKASQDVGADYIEIHTGTFCNALNEEEEDKELAKIREAIETASQLNLRINAGHGLDYRNIKKIVSIKGIEEFSIGHSIIARAVLVGLERAVREMISLIK